jgi:chorismate--pyruvate lyase
MTLNPDALTALLRQSAESPWYDDATQAFGPLSPQAAGWLNERGSLTQRLRDAFGPVTVERLFEGARGAEAAAGLAEGRPVWERCVRLVAAGRPRIAARTCIPGWGPDNPWCEVQQLGDRPLGELLFELGDIERGPLRFARLGADARAPHARRCVYRRAGAVLELTEVFLDGVWANGC